MTSLQKIADIETEIARTQKNKATENHLGVLKAKLAKLKSDIIAASTKGGGKAGDGFDVTKSGDTRVGLIGFPSVGKSTLLTKLTGTESAAASYEFTTLTCIPGTINYKGSKIQLLDLPGIIEGAKDGKGRGRQVIGTARTCNMILVVLDASKPMTHKRVMERELEGFGIRLNKRPPNISIKRKEKGGLSYRTTYPQQRLTEDLVKAICAEYKLANAEVVVNQPNATADDIIDVIELQRGARPPVYVPCLYVLNMIDRITIEELDLLDKVPHYVMISAGHGWGLDDLLEKIWEYLGMVSGRGTRTTHTQHTRAVGVLHTAASRDDSSTAPPPPSPTQVRVYTKPKGQIPDYNEPVILHSERRTIADFCMRIHRGLLKDLKYGWVWGASVKHQPQRVGKEHPLEDEDIVQLVKRTG